MTARNHTRFIGSMIIGSILLLMLTSRPATADGNFALAFNGTSQFGDAPAIPFTNNLWMDVKVNWNGSTGSGGQTVLYNGHSGCTGWGVFLTDSGQLGVLVGGVDIALSTAILAPGEWHNVRVSRVDEIFSLELDGVEYPLSSNPSPTPIGGCSNPAVQEAVLVGNGSGVLDTPGSSPGDAYNGVVDSVRINGIGKPPKAGLTFWHLDEGSGATATDIHGKVLTLHFDPQWVPGHGK